MKDKTYGIDAEAELMKILNREINISIKRDWRKMKIKNIFQ
jgi:hypothetical protein